MLLTLFQLRSLTVLKFVGVEIFGILVHEPEAFDYNHAIGFSCVTTQGKRYGVRMDRNAFDSMDDPTMMAVQSLLKQCQQDWIVRLEVTYETRDTLHKPHK